MSIWNFLAIIEIWAFETDHMTKNLLLTLLLLLNELEQTETE